MDHAGLPGWMLSDCVHDLEWDQWRRGSAFAADTVEQACSCKEQFRPIKIHFSYEQRATRQSQRIKDSKPQDINEKQKCPGDIPK